MQALWPNATYKSQHNYCQESYMKPTFKCLIPLALTAMLTACGGGSDCDTKDTSACSSSATTTATAGLPWKEDFEGLKEGATEDTGATSWKSVATDPVGQCGVLEGEFFCRMVDHRSGMDLCRD